MEENSMKELEEIVMILEAASEYEKRCKCKGSPNSNPTQGISDEQPFSSDEWKTPNKSKSKFNSPDTIID